MGGVGWGGEERTWAGGGSKHTCSSQHMHACATRCGNCAHNRPCPQTDLGNDHGSGGHAGRHIPLRSCEGGQCAAGERRMLWCVAAPPCQRKRVQR